MRSLEMTCGDLEQLLSLALGNEFWETNVGKFPEVTATAGGVAGTVGSCGDCWKLRRVTCEAHNMMENVLCILTVMFSVQL